MYMVEFLESVVSLAVSLYSPDEFTQECCWQSPTGIISTLLSKLRVASLPACILVWCGQSGTNVKLNTVMRNSARGSYVSMLPGSCETSGSSISPFSFSGLLGKQLRRHRAHLHMPGLGPSSALRRRWHRRRDLPSRGFEVYLIPNPSGF